MAFGEQEASKLLSDCHRRCCICHKFCGVKMELHHIEPKAEGGTEDIGNAIPVCFECHAEIGLYNPNHPRGRRFTPEELRQHRGNWVSLCRDRPEVLLDAPSRTEPGTIESLLHEIDFNVEVGQAREERSLGCPFQVSQFDRAIADGTYAMLDDLVRDQLRKTYLAGKRANALLAHAFGGSLTGTPHGDAVFAAQGAVKDAGDLFKEILGTLRCKTQG